MKKIDCKNNLIATTVL